LLRKQFSLNKREYSSKAYSTERALSWCKQEALEAMQRACKFLLVWGAV